MGIENITLKEDATAMTPTGGTDLVFSPDGVQVANGIHVAAPAVTDFRVRPNITFKTRNPTLQNGVYSKAKREVSYVRPKILADGSTVYNLVRISVEVHPESTVAEADDIRFIGSQLLSDTDVVDFMRSGSLA